MVFCSVGGNRKLNRIIECTELVWVTKLQFGEVCTCDSNVRFWS
jgi:hypothetical protein